MVTMMRKVQMKLLANEPKVANASTQVIQIINLLGGRNNIADVDACMTRYVSPYIIQI